MTRETVMDKERLAAFVDGALSPEEAAEVVMHLVDHPQDQAWVDDLMAANDLLARAFDAPMREPVPPAIMAAIRGEAAAERAGGAQVLPFRPRLARPVVAALGAAGLGLAAALTGVALWFPQAGPDGAALALGPVAAGSALATALSDLPAGQVAQIAGLGQVMILASMPATAGYCREIEVQDAAAAVLQAGLACTGAQGWEMAVVIAEQVPQEGASGEGFVAASGTLAAGLSPFLDQLGAGMILTPAEEAALIGAGWR
jgi:hypothetical protein